MGCKREKLRGIPDKKSDVYRPTLSGLQTVRRGIGHILRAVEESVLLHKDLHQPVAVDDQQQRQTPAGEIRPGQQQQ